MPEQEDGKLKLSIPVAVIASLLIGMFGWAFNYAMQQQGASGGSAVRIEKLEQALNTHLANSVPLDGYRRDIDQLRLEMHNYVPLVEFQTYSKNLDSRLDEIRADLRSLREAMDRPTAALRQK